GALLAQAGRSEVDGDPPHRPLELGRRDPAPDAVLRLLAGTICKPDDREAWNAELDVRLDLDPAGVEADECMRERACEHASQRSTTGSRVCVECEPASARHEYTSDLGPTLGVRASPHT